MAGLTESVANMLGNGLEWDQGTSDELIQLKKEMANRVIDKMQEKKWDFSFSIGKDMIVDYLVDEGLKDSLKDELILWNLLNVFTSSSDDLKNLRGEIVNLKTAEELKDFEEKLIKQIELDWSLSVQWVRAWDTPAESWDASSESSNTSTESQDQTSSEPAESSDASTSDSASQSEPDSSTDSWEVSWGEGTEEMSPDSAQVGEAKEVELKKRMAWLFPEWVPQTEKQMKKYLKKIKVPILLANWKTKKLKLYVHKKLANEYIAIFNDMKNAWIKVNPDTTACFNWRKMRKSSKMSHHSYWTAIDVNWDVNGGVYWKTDQSSPYFNDQACVDIWKKHWFYWGWDWSARNNDPMHFTYMNA